MDRNTKALKTLAIIAAALTYAGAVVYGDVMFISVMGVAFPGGTLGALAIAGAVMTAASALTLPIALHYWLSPGLQFIWGVIFWLVDIIVLSLNAMLAYAIAAGSADPWLMQWQALAPATPMLAVIGWGLVFLLDPSHKLRHAQAALDAELIDIHASQLLAESKSQTVQNTMAANAKSKAAATASALTGVPQPAQAALRPMTPANGRTIHADEDEPTPTLHPKAPSRTRGSKPTPAAAVGPTAAGAGKKPA